MISFLNNMPSKKMLLAKILLFKQKFSFNGQKYAYFIHEYNTTYKNERAVEIPIFKNILDANSNKKILEIGNVLSHYFKINHKVVDKYEKSPGVINKDALTYQSKNKYDLILAISTFEHIGFDDWGYNYQGQMFLGGYCDAYRDADWCQPYKDVKLSMKWNDAWLSNQDCDGDGLLDRHYGHDSYIGSGAWLTNHQSGSYTEFGQEYNWNYFVKIVAVQNDATQNGGIWYTTDGDEIGPVIWGEFAVIQEIYNDQGTGDHGVLYKSPVGPGFGKY
jgi:hypothetical protein